MTPDEQWKPVVGYEGLYEVSDLGRVRSLDRVVMRSNGRPATVVARTLAVFTRVEDSGFARQTVKLSSDGAPRTHSVHALVMAAFIGPRPADADICHGNGDGVDNRLSNLRYDTRSANIRDAVRHGTHQATRKTHCLRGHLLVEPNLSGADLRKGHRYCRSCMRARSNVRIARARDLPYDMQKWSDDHYAQIMELSDGASDSPAAASC